MKRFFALLVVLSMLIAMTACGGSKEQTETKAPSTSENVIEEVPEEVETEEASSGIEVDENLLTVEITLPAGLVGEDMTQESLNVGATEGNYKSATLNEDGSATYIMTKAQHRKMLGDLSVSIDEAVADMIGSEDYPTIVDIEISNDYTNYDVALSANTVGFNESFSAIAFYFYGSMYSMMKGAETPDIVTVSFINNETGEVIETGTSEGMFS